MALVNSSKEKSSNITEILTSSTCDVSVKLQCIENLKSCFKPTKNILWKIKLESLLQEGEILLKSNSYKKDFLLTYGTRLINCIGKDVTLDPKLYKQVEYILLELQMEDESLSDKLFIKISQLPNVSSVYFDGILTISKHTFERRVLDWVENNDSLDMEFLARMCANSPKLFQTVTSILYSIMVKTLAHWRVFEVTTSFTCLVVSFCTKNEKDFLGLYPENFRRIVSLLMVSPELYFNKINKIEVLDLLMEMFVLDRKNILIILSHYPEWLCVFKNYLIKKEY